MKIEFHGAAGGVTGSCFLLECAGTRVLIDCGLYQGGREIEDENHEPFGFEPETIDYLLLTHAHLDHCGRIPLLERRGFRGEIITTPATRELARLVMLDAAHLNEEEAARGTPARQIIDGAETVRLFGEEIRVRASIYTIGGFSAHADTDELYQWFRSAPPPATTFLVHGEDQAMEAFARRLAPNRVIQPKLHETFDL